jgi:hypothetical protein
MDVGYTHGQGRSRHWHANFIKQTLVLADLQPSFRWCCETFLQVESFWKEANDRDRSRFAEHVRNGKISLSASWANFTELPDQNLFASMVSRAKQFADQYGLPLVGAMMADINGCPLIHARALAGQGVKFLLTHVHPHHGSVPFGKRTLPFWWDLGDGSRLLVHHGEHYHLGNELGLSPGAETNYLIFTDPARSFDQDQAFDRLTYYIRSLESSGWKYEWAVLTVSGLITDNAPPSPIIVKHIAQWNAHAAVSGLPPLVMSTLNDIADVIAKEGDRLPTFAGDWPDWWSDGSASDPDGMRLFKHALRQRNFLAALGKQFPKTHVDLENLDLPLAMYAEHTYGHSHSVVMPSNFLAQQLRMKKQSSAADAADYAEVLVESAAEQIGYGTLAFNRPFKFRVINVEDSELRGAVEFEWEWCENVRWGIQDSSVELRDESTGEIIAHQTAPSMRGTRVIAEMTVPGAATIDIAVRPVMQQPPEPSINLSAPTRIGPKDLTADHAQSDVTPHFVKSKYTELVWDEFGNVVRWIDLKSGRSLLCGDQLPPFTLTGNRTRCEADGALQASKRRSMGRNRRLATSETFMSHGTGLNRLQQGPLFDTFVAQQSCDGFESLNIMWTIWHNFQRVDAEVIGCKIGTWDAENVYCALPFTAGNGSVVWLDRGFPMRPWKDQLPGTLVDYYGVQEGLAWCGDQFGVAVGTPDSHLIHCGDLRCRERLVMGDQDLPGTPDEVYAWLMTNYWETNFAAEVGGFHSFKFSVIWGEDLAEPTKALTRCHLANSGLRAIRLGS